MEEIVEIRVRQGKLEDQRKVLKQPPSARAQMGKDTWADIHTQLPQQVSKERWGSCPCRDVSSLSDSRSGVTAVQQNPHHKEELDTE